MATKERVLLKWSEDEGCPICGEKKISHLIRDRGANFRCKGCYAVFAGSASDPRLSWGAPPYEFTGIIWIGHNIPDEHRVEVLKDSLLALSEPLEVANIRRPS